MSAFEYARNRTAAFEGGFVNDPDDRGGATMWGASEPYARQHGYQGRMRDLSRATVDAWFRSDFWDGFGLGELPDQEVAARIFDIGVNHSPKGAATIIQRACAALGESVTVDGQYGPRTRAAVLTLAKRYPDSLVGALNGERWKYYLSIIEANLSQRKFVRGWAKRCA